MVNTTADETAAKCGAFKGGNYKRLQGGAAKKEGGYGRKVTGTTLKKLLKAGAQDFPSGCNL